MRYINTIIAFCMFLSLQSCTSLTEEDTIDYIDQYNVVWEAQSKNSSESMPLGGGDIGCNVWVENGDILFYMSRSGTFDENNTMLKLGRTRIQLNPNPFKGKNATFKQELNLREGCVYITGKNQDVEATIKLWVEVFQPEIHVDIESSKPISVKSIYETWRTKDKKISEKERRQCLSFLFTKPEIIPLTTYKDSIFHTTNTITWYHRNRNNDLVFDKEITQQHLDDIRSQLSNPLRNLTFGGSIEGVGMSFLNTINGNYQINDFKGWVLQSDLPKNKHEIDIRLHIAQTETTEEWKKGLETLGEKTISKAEAWKKNVIWWNEYWNRSHIIINAGVEDKENDQGWQIGRNYQLFRYMLGCNAYGEYPTKFNGGLFTVDNPEYGTPDYRDWGGGSFTAQNQRLVYWPMLKSGDFDMMKSQFDYYLRVLKNAELRTKQYWGHEGAGFVEQIENFGLPIGETYHHRWGNEGLGRRKEEHSTRTLKTKNGDTVKVVDYGYLNNEWVEDEYETILEFCLMILDVEQYTSQDISTYIPLIKSSLTFFDEHFKYWNKKLNGTELDDNGKLVLYPSTACETYKMAENPTPLIAGLRNVLSRIVELPEKYVSNEQKEGYKAYLNRVPEISLMEKDGHTTIAPAKNWERISNIEFPQLYAVYPYNHYGIGKPDLKIAINTWKYGSDAPIQKSEHCWFQSGVFCARMGLVEEAQDYLEKKMLAQSKRFPAFWVVPGFDQWPDFDHGGAGMINLQEMLLQTDGKEIRVLPTWPKEWDVDFKLHAPYKTVVSVTTQKGVEKININPESRKTDIVKSN